jgi:hypothetical protein
VVAAASGSKIIENFIVDDVTALVWNQLNVMMNRKDNLTRSDPPPFKASVCCMFIMYDQMTSDQTKPTLSNLH